MSTRRRSLKAIAQTPLQAVLLVLVMVFQPTLALAMSNGAGAQQVQLELGDEAACGGTACCCEGSQPGAQSHCPCAVAPMAPADAPLPFFAPAPAGDSGPKSLGDWPLGLVRANLDLSSGQRPPLACLRQRAGPLIRLLSRGTLGRLAFLQTARL